MPGHVKLTIYHGLGNLPHFNPEIDTEFPPPPVSDFRSQLRNSAGVIISTPEYAHGIPGVLKNALDWLVASGELYEKPVALFSTSPRGRFAHASLIETLTVMMARLIPEAFINVSPPLGMGNGELQVSRGIYHCESNMRWPSLLRQLISKRVYESIILLLILLFGSDTGIVRQNLQKRGKNE